MTGPSYDAIVVLGSPARPGGKPSPALVRRMAHAVRLFRDGRGGWLLLTGGAGGRRPAEAEVMRDLAVAASVPQDRIVLDTRSADTFENVVNTVSIMRQRGWSSLVVVSDGFHLGRALYVFRRLGVAADGSAAMRQPRDRLSTEAYVRAREVAARLWYVYRVRLRDRRTVASIRAVGQDAGAHES